MPTISRKVWSIGSHSTNKVINAISPEKDVQRKKRVTIYICISKLEEHQDYLSSCASKATKLSVT